MLKYRVTNISASSKKGARNVFLTEAGKLLKPGDKCPVNRLDKGTMVLVDAGVLKLEEGSFAPTPIFPESEPAKQASDDGAAKAKAEAEAKEKAKAEILAKAKAEAEAKALAEAEAASAEETDSDESSSADDADSSSEDDSSSKKKRRNRRGEG